MSQPQMQSARLSRCSSLLQLTTAYYCLLLLTTDFTTRLRCKAPDCQGKQGGRDISRVTAAHVPCRCFKSYTCFLISLPTLLYLLLLYFTGNEVVAEFTTVAAEAGKRHRSLLLYFTCFYSTVLLLYFRETRR